MLNPSFTGSFSVPDDSGKAIVVSVLREVHYYPGEESVHVIYKSGLVARGSFYVPLDSGYYRMKYFNDWPLDSIDKCVRVSTTVWLDYDIQP